ncbi:Phospholipid:diacylglycerol acyltransferase [Nakaseomyces bracarensis]|uniref:Phospholipid:diacylglycerol acyltransferase n=1 Tax=Nakaseomyces bracarensis TaxID=273131 RepID=A0ABR4NQP2_9SACH
MVTKNRSRRRVSKVTVEVEDAGESENEIRGETVEIDENEEPVNVTRHSRRGSMQDDDKLLDRIMPKMRRKRWRDSKRFIFSLGAFFGLLIPVYFGAMHVHSNNKELLDGIMNFDVFRDYFDEWMDILPEGFTSFLNDIQAGYLSSGQNLTQNFGVGKQYLQDFNVTSKHPVVMVPGVISTGIESWGVIGDEECDSTPHFRKRLWGSFYMLRTMVMDKVCWLKHVKLDPLTGLDPPNFTLRAAQGFESSDFFIAGYWIWNKVLENLAVIGYDPNRMTTASYDWRLAYLDLERRDRYFSKLKSQIELFYESSGEKVCLVGHSMGSQVAFYFMKWVEAEGPHYGNGGKGWVAKYIDSYINVAGTLLGAPKAVPALISGEMKDTIQLNAIAMYGLEKFFSRKERLDMIRTWGGVPSMLPKGGNLIWGDMNSSPEDELYNNTDTYGNFIRFQHIESDDVFKKNLTMIDSIDLIKEISPDWLKERIENQYSFGYSKTEREMKENEKNHKYWTNPLEVPLPHAPDLKIYCFYGLNNPTERAYVYRQMHNDNESALNLTIDYDSARPVYLTEGDGTVPLITHSICHKWAQGVSAYNPAGANVTIVEMKHRPDKFDIRGGPNSAEHVDILGSAELNEYILRVATGKGDTIKSKVFSNLTQWVKEMKFPM